MHLIENLWIPFITKTCFVKKYPQYRVDGMLGEFSQLLFHTQLRNLSSTQDESCLSTEDQAAVLSEPPISSLSINFLLLADREHHPHPDPFASAFCSAQAQTTS